MKYSALYDELYRNGYHDASEDKKFSHTEHLIEYIQRTVGPWKRILDVGCSHGHGLDILHGIGYHVYGIDISKEAIQKCDEYFQDGNRVAVGSCSSIPHPAGMFDAITCTDVLEHVPEEELNTAVDEFARVLKPGGHVVAKIGIVEEVDQTFTHIAEKHGAKSLHVTVRETLFWEQLFSRKFHKLHSYELFWTEEEVLVGDPLAVAITWKKI
jgi:2-polyprenyl-3-methyl-5-hydroxy-6-metoxy-1,4-benzoquinol methylase